jgi:hypothetical protein
MHIIVPKFTSVFFSRGGYENIAVNSDRIMRIVDTTISSGAGQHCQGAEIIMDDGEQFFIVEGLLKVAARLHTQQFMHDVPMPV